MISALKTIDLKEPMLRVILCVSRILNSIYYKLQAHKVVLFKGPPGTGKTSTGHLLKHYGLETGKYKTVYSICCTIDEPGLIQQLQKLNSSVRSVCDLTNVKEPTLLIIDEAQLMYSQSKESGHAELFRVIKHLMLYRCNKLDILLIVSHGESYYISECQFSPQNMVFPWDVAFTEMEQELRVMAHKWNNLEYDSGSALNPPVKMSELVPLSKAVVDELYKLTAGHVGLCRLMVESLGDMFLDPNLNKEQKYPVAEEAVIAALHSDFMMEKIMASRIVPPKWLPEDEPTVQRIVTEQCIIFSILDEKLYTSVRRLIKSGLVTELWYGRACFTSPMLVKAAKHRLNPDSNVSE